MSTRYLWAVAAIACACKPGAKPNESKTSNDSTPAKVATITGFQTPESVRWDSAQDVYFVSNINGNPSAKDGNGFISIVDPAGAIRDSAFIKGLNAPKGMALVHDTLWVTDIDVVRGFDARTGAPVATVPISGAVFLNDITAAPDGSLYVTDSAIRFGAKGQEHVGTDQIFRVGPDRKVSSAIKNDSLSRPNGITWDAANQRFIVVSIGGTKSLFAWKPGDAAPSIIGSGPGGYDGVEFARGAMLVSSWADSSVYRFANGQGAKLISNVASPADIGYDAKRNRVLIPVFTGNRVEIWQLR
ncbi:MAG: SMP-30/gluconolactonase/LRE family protein [Gemmatimonadales bacterium]